MADQLANVKAEDVIRIYMEKAVSTLTRKQTGISGLVAAMKTSGDEGSGRLPPYNEFLLLVEQLIRDAGESHLVFDLIAEGHINDNQVKEDIYDIEPLEVTKNIQYWVSRIIGRFASL